MARYKMIITKRTFATMIFALLFSGLVFSGNYLIITGKNGSGLPGEPVLIYRYSESQSTINEVARIQNGRTDRIRLIPNEIGIAVWEYESTRPMAEMIKELEKMKKSMRETKYFYIPDYEYDEKSGFFSIVHFSKTITPITTRVPLNKFWYHIIRSDDPVDFLTIGMDENNTVYCENDADGKIINSDIRNDYSSESCDNHYLDGSEGIFEGVLLVVIDSDGKIKYGWKRELGESKSVYRIDYNPYENIKSKIGNVALLLLRINSSKIAVFLNHDKEKGGFLIYEKEKKRWSYIESNGRNQVRLFEKFLILTNESENCRAFDINSGEITQFSKDADMRIINFVTPDEIILHKENTIYRGAIRNGKISYYALLTDERFNEELIYIIKDKNVPGEECKTEGLADCKITKLNVIPKMSSGDQEIHISGLVVDRKNNKPMSWVPLDISIKTFFRYIEPIKPQVMFQRHNRICTSENGLFDFKFKPSYKEIGKMFVDVVVAKNNQINKSEEIVIGLLQISAEEHKTLSLYEKNKIEIILESGYLTTISNLRVEYYKEDQENKEFTRGLQLILPPAIEKLPEDSRQELIVNVNVNAECPKEGRFVLRVVSDEPTLKSICWKKITVFYQLAR